MRLLQRLLTASLFVFNFGHAADVAVPDELKSWQGWALHGEEFRRCPFFANHQPNSSNDFVCAWPERLVLNVNAHGGDFTQRWQIFAESWIALPGNNEHWPRAVRLNGVPAPVVTHNGVPSLRLDPGSYTINGSLQWSTRPEQIPIPPQTGIVELAVDGHVIQQPERPDGAVWLGKRRNAEQAEQMSMQVYRLVQDDVPTMLSTQIRLQVSGEAREETLGKALPEHFTPMALASSLPARIEKDGTLRVQLRPGQWIIAIEARGNAVLSEMSAPIVDVKSEEVWSYRANDRLRVTAVEGVPTIDPAQANAPADWRGLPTYRITKDVVLKIAERSRGLANQDANQLTLHRQLWFDFGHGGYTAVDTISGTMRENWRLDMAQPFSLLSARMPADSSNLLVTHGAQTELSGVEVRSPSLNLQTVGRLTEASGRIPATGWQTRFTSVSGQLNLPPGHHLLSAIGDVDTPTSWTATWRLLDFFVVLIVAVSAWRLRGVVFGGLALMALVLVHQEESLFAWLLINALIAIALVNVAPLGKLKTVMQWYRGISLVVIALTFLPFAVSQIRLGLYPQLETEADSVLVTATRAKIGAPEKMMKDLLVVEQPVEVSTTVPAATPPPAMHLELPEAQTAEMRTDEDKQKQGFSRASSTASVTQRYAPGTVVQVGPGLPSWSFNSYPYSWNGPVDASESLRFIIATPFWMFLWRVLGVVLLGAVIVEVARMSFSLTAARNFMQPFTKNASLVIALLVAAITAPYGAKADTPSDELLTELKARLTQPPKCSPNCAEVMFAQVSASADKLDMTLDVAALANVAVAVPAAVGRWEPESLAVDGQSAGAVYRDPQLRYWVALKSGAHSIRLSGRLAAAESIQIVFPQIPKVIATSGSGWEFSGVNEDRLLTNTLELVRVRTGSTADKLFASAQFAPFVRVRRFVQFDLDWTMTTTVERIAPDKGAFTIEVPLLKDESVLTAGMTLREKNGARLVLVGLTAGQNQFSWNSALPHAEAMELTMPESADRTEHWRFLVSPIWNVQFKGVPQVAPENVNATPWTFDYFPRANETLSLAVYRPDAVAGQTLAIDDVFIASNVGPRSTDTVLQLKVRSTQGGRHTITLPKDANVSSVTVDEIAVPVRPQDGELPISLLPGAHRLAINWQSDAGASFRTTSADVSLQAPASNIRTRITLGGERWVLFARGAGVGPAILYWGELLVFIAIALLLGRYTESPLKTRDWLLLGLGLSTFSWSVLLLFAIWIFAMRWRGGMTEPSSAVRFNLLQLALGVLTVISVGALVSAIPTGLLSEPDMSMHSSTDGYLWFVDQSTSKLPDAALYSVPLVVYKIAILLWALWLSFALLRWLPWAWRAFSHNGIWRSSNFQQIVKGE